MSAVPSTAPVSVVVCNYNGELYLPACLDGILALEGGFDECIVVDNASTDGSVALLEADYPQVRILRMESNGGPAPARNAGMRAARNRRVLAVDNDAIPRPDLLLKLQQAFDSGPDVAIVQPRSVFHHDLERVHYDGGDFHFAGLIALRNFYTPLDQAQGQGTLDVDVAVSVCLLLDRDRVLALGGYDESYFILFEDLDLSYRVRSAGGRILSVEDAIVEHRAGTPGVSFREGTDYPSSRVFYHSRNRWLFMFKCFSARTLLLSVPALLVYEAMWLAFAVVKGGAGSWVRGKREVYDRRHALAADRARVQAARTRSDASLLVGGPLTLTPALKDAGLARLVSAMLDRVLRVWWAIISPLCR
ncbi:MAG: GT2 family glycosyltransferase [Chlamydiales bacterium]|jgi:GT2 family glycosyltransferase